MELICVVYDSSNDIYEIPPIFFSNFERPSGDDIKIILSMNPTDVSKMDIKEVSNMETNIDKLELSIIRSNKKSPKKDVFNLDTKLISGFNEPFELISQDWNHLHKIEPELIERSLTSDSDNIYIDGYWQSPKYFDNTSDYFKNFKYPIKKESSELMHDIINSNSIMINIRRTDFVNNDFSGCFGRDYIDKSLLNFKEIDYKIFIFSDDIEWCEENLSDLGTIVSHDHKGYKFSNYLQLMSLCKFFIIPNSSFAWWSAYLSNSSKMVCYPENWILNYHKKIEDLFPENWIKIK
jgi:hypothetical protein